MPTQAFETLFGHALFLGRSVDVQVLKLATDIEEKLKPIEPKLWYPICKMSAQWEAQSRGTSELQRLLQQHQFAPPEASLREGPRLFAQLGEQDQLRLLRLMLCTLTRLRLLWEGDEVVEIATYRRESKEESLLDAEQQQVLTVLQETATGMACHVFGLTEDQAFESVTYLVSSLVHGALPEGSPISNSKQVVEAARALISGIQPTELERLAAAFSAKRNDSGFGVRLYMIDHDIDPNGEVRGELDSLTAKLVAQAQRDTSGSSMRPLWRAIVQSVSHKFPFKPPAPILRNPQVAEIKHDVNRRCVRVIRMVHELHKAGYQRLRLIPALTPSGCHWRAHITASSNVTSDGLNLIDWRDSWSADPQTLTATYTSGHGNQYFEWKDAQIADARKLAALFLERFPRIAREAQGLDWAYAGWFVDFLGEAEASDDGGGHLVHFFQDWDADETYLKRWQPPPPIR